MHTQLFSRLTGALALCFLFACNDDGTAEESGTDESGTGTESGDGDGDGDGDTGDGDGEPGDGDGEPVLSNVLVEVTYAGMQTGNLSLAAMTQFPPVGPPVAALTDEMPTFPYMGTLMALEPGDYYITAVLDVGANNPQSPGPEDLFAVTPMPVTVTDGNVMVALELVD